MKARDNPFSSKRLLTVRYRLEGTTWQQLINRLAEMKYRAAVVGPEGTGKTTLLENFQPRLRDLGFVVRPLRLTAERRTFPPGFLRSFCRKLTHQDIILFDGAEQLNALRWFRFKIATRRAGGLIIASHRPGRLATLIECSTTPELLDEILQQLVPDQAESLRHTARRLFHEHHGNLREVLFALYDLYAQRVTANSSNG